MGKREEWTCLFKASQDLESEFDQILDDLAHKYGNEFAQMEGKHESKSNGEYSLKQHQVHQMYMNQCGGILEAFVEKEGVDYVEFMKECEDSLNGTYCALFEEDINQWFVELLMSISDFSYFINVMNRKVSQQGNNQNKK